MSIAVVRLGAPRSQDEGLRIGTVRRPPRGVPKEHYAPRDWYDVWFPNLAPSAETLNAAHAAKSESDWQRFKRTYRREMSQPAARHDIALLAALSRDTNLSVGCYCDDEQHCHRSVLKQLLKEAGASLAQG